MHAVDLGQHTVAVDAADVVAGKPRACTGTAHRNAWLVTHQILDAVDVVAVELFAGVDGDSAGHAAHVLLLTRGADGHLLQVERAGVNARLEDDVVAAQFAIVQVGPHQQALEGFFRCQRSAHARRLHALSQFGGKADLPAGHSGKGIERRHQRLRRNGECVIAHFARRLLGGSGGHDRCSTGHQNGGGQQRQNAGG
ncbi:hypothetical protein D3C76_1177340 [compost metagenome]